MKRLINAFAAVAAALLLALVVPAAAQDSRTASFTATGSYAVTAGNYNSIAVQLTGTWVGTVNFEQSPDGGTTWTSKTLYPVGGGAGVTSATANGTWKAAGGAMTTFRVRVAAYTSGTINTTVLQTSAVDVVAVPGIVGVVGQATVVEGNFTRPNNTTAYASGQIIAQSTTAGSCSAVALAVARVNDASGMVRRVRVKVNDSTNWLNAAVRVHFFRDAPTFTNGDGGTFAGGLTESSYIGYADVTLDQKFSDPYAKGFAAPAVGSEFNFIPSAGTQNIYAVLEARSAVTPAASKAFTITVEALQN